MSRYFSIDSLAIRNGRVFGWGWFLDAESRMGKGHLLLTLADGSELAVPCLGGAARADVAAAYPDVEHATTCGFMLMATTPVPVDTERGARFVAELANGERHEIRIQALPLTTAAAPAPLLTRLRRHGMRGTISAVVRVAGQCWSASWAGWRVLREKRSRRPAVVVFDHDMGGGANLYRRRRIAELAASGSRVVLVTPRLAALEYGVSVHDACGEIARWSEPDDEALLAALSRLRLQALEINNLVGFSDPTRVADWCVAQRRHFGIPLTFHLHDFHAVCPAFTLIDADDRYCGVPAIETCRACLPRNAANSLGLGQGVDPVGWRAAWSNLLESADRVIAFSEASATILRRAYPAVAHTLKVEIRPHAVTHAHLRRVVAPRGETLKVAVVGNISRPKGADIVVGIAALASAASLPLQVVVIGTLQASAPPNDHLLVHGSFKPEELPELMERYGINLCLMPSVCPETYSFVTDEIMAMGLPIAVFDLGAPAERVARYPLGEVIPEITAEDALAGIIRLAQRTAGPHEARKEHS